jgi:phosphoglycolate phosphatase
MKFKGVIFDLDGTLIDSVEDIADSMNIVLRKHNFPTHNIKIYKRFLGKGIKNLVFEALPEAHKDKQIRMECFNAMNDAYFNNCTNKTKPYDGIFDLLNELVSKEIKFAVLSNKADEFTKKIVITLFPNWNFEFIVGMTNEVNKKPNPQGALQISHGLGIQPDKIIFVGDSGIDMQTANNAGMHAVGALWGFKTKEELSLNGAKHLIEHPLELIQIL